ncbi:MAG: helix-hairpin-helix domain-containing protein [Candidatus Methanospirareceae archaeon]
MCVPEKQSALQELQQIPGVGKKTAEDLWTVGIRTIADLQGRDPEALFSRLQARAGAPIDRCVLYVFRCAVYYASHEHHEPELLKWWHWKD